MQERAFARPVRSAERQPKEPGLAPSKGQAEPVAENGGAVSMVLSKLVMIS
jgi:hypothetical protein